MTAYKKLSYSLTLVATAAVAGLSSTSRSDAQNTNTYQLSPELLSLIENNPQSAAEQYIQQLYSLSQSGVLTQNIVENGALFDASQARATFLTNFLKYDLDGNFDVSEDEVERVASFENERQISRVRTQIKLGDANGDTTLSLDEMLELFDDSLNRQNGRSRNLSQLMEFDENADGRVTTDEILSIIAKVTGGDVIAAPTNRPPILERLSNPAPTCTLPLPSETAEVVFISGYEGSFVSSVAAESQDRETSLVKLAIEPGTAPLYVVATAFDSIMWQFTGATERVERVVVSDIRGVGVVGIDSERVEITERQRCLPGYAYELGSSDLSNAQAAISVRLSREIDHTYTSYDLGEISLPSGSENLRQYGNAYTGRQVFIRDELRHIETEDGFVPIEGPNADPKLIAELSVERMLYRRYPGGVAEIDADDVVSKRPIQQYEVLPQQAGLLQLVRSGHLELLASNRFRIAKTFSRFPAGLSGGHSVRFLLAAGVEMPLGSPGHSSVIEEDTGACLFGHRCR